MDFVEIDEWVHSHEFALPAQSGEKKVKIVILLTLVMMMAEVSAGMVYGSMSLLADGWHMGTHVLALGVAFFAYSFARKHSSDPSYVFGTGKISVLGGFASAVMLGFAAIMISFESVERFFTPEKISFNEAMLVAVIGLAINLVSAAILHEGHDHHDHEHKGLGHGHDHNLKAAYFHVAADALTSLAAIFALSAGKYLEWVWLDPFMGIVGSLVILKWSYGLVLSSSRILVDCNTDKSVSEKIRACIEVNNDAKVLDLHVWNINQNELAAVISISAKGKSPSYYKKILAQFREIVHITIEINNFNNSANIDNKTRKNT